MGKVVYNLVQSKYLPQTKLQALSPLETVVSVDKQYGFRNTKNSQTTDTKVHETEVSQLISELAR